MIPRKSPLILRTLSEGRRLVGRRLGLDATLVRYEPYPQGLLIAPESQRSRAALGEALDFILLMSRRYRRHPKGVPAPVVRAR
jgi:hypothetical protein